MFGYYVRLAIQSLRRNPMLTGLMIAAVGVGISASMTTLTVYRGITADPIPRKSSELFVPQIDNWGPHSAVTPPESDHLEYELSYADAVNLMTLHGAPRQAAMYQAGLILKPSDSRIRAFNVSALATYCDFFSMFAVPFRYGRAWTAADDEDRASVVVLSHSLNDKLFGGVDSVGRQIRLGGRTFRIVGVLRKWRPIPRFYDLSNNPYGKPQDLFIPFTRAIEGHMRTTGSYACNTAPHSGWSGFTHSECTWIHFWVELPTSSKVRAYRSMLINYAAQQRRLGRFHWAPRVQLRDVRAWLSYHQLVSDEVRILVLLSFAFLVVCLLNAMALMLAKLASRAGDLGVRRALGASSHAIFLQCIIESSTIGLAGGVFGLCLATLSFAGLRALLSSEGRPLLHLDATDAAITILLAIAVTILVALYPTWKAARSQPTLQLKAL